MEISQDGTNRIEKASTLNNGFKNKTYLKKSTTVGGPYQKIYTKLSVPEIFLMKIPLSLCPSLVSGDSDKKKILSKKSSMIDFGLGSNPLKRRLTTLKKKTFTRKITITDLMSKKATRQIWSSLSSQKIFQTTRANPFSFDGNSANKINSSNTPTIQSSEFNNIKKNLFPTKSGMDFLPELLLKTSNQDRINSVKALDRILISCDTLAEENQMLSNRLHSRHRHKF
jgi:hypothetical protein